MREISACETELAKLKRNFTQLLISQGNEFTKPQNNESHLLSHGFHPKVIKSVLSKMKRSGRPFSHYSKVTGLLKCHHSNRMKYH